MLTRGVYHLQMLAICLLGSGNGGLRFPVDCAFWLPVWGIPGTFPWRSRVYWSYASRNMLEMMFGFPTTPDLKQNVCVRRVLSYPGKAHTPELADILENSVRPNVQLITHVLSSEVRPVFQSHVHPKVNPSTGRALNRVAGGPLASQDLYTSQSWKENHPGISNVLLWVVARIKVKTLQLYAELASEPIQSSDYDRIWHLVIPPIMTLLDDYEVPYKLRGIAVISQMLKTVPPDLLRRTGVDDLIFSVRVSLCIRFCKKFNHVLY